MKLILLLLIPLNLIAQVATIKLSDNTFIVNAPSGQSWENVEPIGFSVYEDGDILKFPAYNLEAYTTYGSWYSPEKGVGCECTYSGKQNDSLVFKFTNAERFEFWGELMSHHGMADIYFDNEFKETIDTYGPDNLTPVLNYSEENLDKDKVHTFKLVIKGQKNPSSTGNYVVMKYFKLINSQPIEPPIEPPVNVVDTVYTIDTVYLRPYIYIKTDDIEYKIE